MISFAGQLQNGSVWLYFPTAILIGALHGLEPGHSKTMMAAFIVAIRGTILQAVLLGAAAAVSHSLVIWAIAALALNFGQHWNVETTEPYFQMAGGVIVIAMALWTFWRMRREQRRHHHHHDETKVVESTLGTGELTIFEDGVPPHFRFLWKQSEPLSAVTIETIRPSGERQAFPLTRGATAWASGEPIPEPHEFRVEVQLAASAGAEVMRLEFHEAHDHATQEPDDAHARGHASDIARRFANRSVTTPQIVLFGLTGGLMPCPAAFSVLILCLQLKRVALGFALVAAFSIGLALTLVSVGVVAAWSVGQARKRFSDFGKLAALAPYISLSLLLGLGTFLFIRGAVDFA